MLFSALSFVFLSTAVRAYPSIAADVPAAAGSSTPSSYVYGFGMGVQDRKKSSEFYNKAFDLEMSATFDAGIYKEDVLVGNDDESILENMKWADERPTKNLPVKIQFWCKDPAKTLDAMVAAGGKKDSLKTESAPTAIYGRDLDGYLLELLPIDKSVYTKPAPEKCMVREIGVGTSNLAKSAEFWSKFLQIPAGPVQKFAEWSSVTFTPSQNVKLTFIDWNETPKRSSKNIPVKIIVSPDSMYNAITRLRAAGAAKMEDITDEDAKTAPMEFVEEPIDNIFVGLMSSDESVAAALAAVASN